MHGEKPREETSWVGGTLAINNSVGRVDGLGIECRRKEGMVEAYGVGPGLCVGW